MLTLSLFLVESWKDGYADGVGTYRTQMEEEQDAFDDMILSELGSMTLEFTRLTQLSGDPKFFDAVQRIQDMLERHQDLTKLPGMWPIVIDATGEGKFDLHSAFTLGLMADSVYACLPKVCFFTLETFDRRTSTDAILLLSITYRWEDTPTNPVKCTQMPSPHLKRTTSSNQ